MILITGATGFIGSKLVDLLLDKGFSIAVLCLPNEINKVRKTFHKVKVFKGDILKKDTLKKAFRNTDTVVHLAGIISYKREMKQKLLDVNWIGTRNVVEMCKEHRIKKIIFSSSVSVYGEIEKDSIADESYRTKPVNWYGKSKLMAEGEVIDSELEYVILRFAPVYGKGSNQWLKNLEMLEKGFPLPKTKNYTHVLSVYNAVNALKNCIEKGYGIYNIADSVPIPFVKLASMIMKKLGKKPRFVPSWMFNLLTLIHGVQTYTKVLVMNRNYSIERAKREINYKPVERLNQDIEEIIKWYKCEQNFSL